MFFRVFRKSLGFSPNLKKKHWYPGSRYEFLDNITHLLAPSGIILIELCNDSGKTKGDEFINFMNSVYRAENRATLQPGPIEK